MNGDQIVKSSSSYYSEVKYIWLQWYILLKRTITITWAGADVAVQNTEARNKQLISKFKRYLLTAQAKQIIAK